MEELIHKIQVLKGTIGDSVRYYEAPELSNKVMVLCDLLIDLARRVDDEARERKVTDQQIRTGHGSLR